MTPSRAFVLMPLKKAQFPGRPHSELAQEPPNPLRQTTKGRMLVL